MAGFSNNLIATINYIECPLEISRDSVVGFETSAKDWLNIEAKVHVLDFRRVQKVHASFYAALIRFQKDLKEKNLKAVSINFETNIEDQLKRDGVFQIFGYIKDFKNLQASNKAPPPPETEMRPLVVKYVVEAARKAMDVLFQATVAADENFLENLKNFRTDIFHRAAVIDVTSDFLKAQFRLYFTKDTLQNLTRVMVGEANVDEETCNSTATELLNMIYGGAKSRLNDDKDYSIPPAIPTLVLKEQILNLGRKADPKKSVCIPFASPLGTYYLEIDFG